MPLPAACRRANTHTRGLKKVRCPGRCSALGGCADRRRIRWAHPRSRRHRPLRPDSVPTANRPPTRRRRTARPMRDRWWCPRKFGAAPDLFVDAQLRTFPSVKGLLVRRCHVVEHHEDLGFRVLDDGSQSAFPADVFAAEGQPPAVQPAGSGHWRVWCALHHLLRIHVRPVSGVDRHGKKLKRHASSRCSTDELARLWLVWGLCRPA
jgi:hypothetical protein